MPTKKPSAKRAPRQRKFKVGALNVVVHPHNPKTYHDLFVAAYKLQRIIPIESDRRAYLGSCFPIATDPLDGLEGNVYRFTEIDPASDWLNMLTGSEAEPDEIEKHVEIPVHLKPNFMAIRYSFFPKTHTIVFEITRHDPIKNKQTNFSPSMAEKFFKKLFGDNQLQLKFPNIEVTVKQSSKTLDHIFSIPRLRNLHIVIKKPNPNADDFEEEIERQLEEENAEEYEVVLKSRTNEEGLKPSQKTKAMARIALSNGYVQGSGKDTEGQTMEFKTIDKPDVDTAKYDPKKGYSAAFLALASSISDRKLDATTVKNA